MILATRATRFAVHPAPERIFGLLRAAALAPLRLAKIAFSRVRPSPPIAIKDFSQFIEYFGSNPHSPASKSFASGPSGSFFFPSSAHRGNFEQIRPLCRHGTQSYQQFLRSCCLMAAKISQSHGDVRQLHELRDPLGIIPIGSFDPWRQPTSSCATTPKES